MKLRQLFVCVALLIIPIQTLAATTEDLNSVNSDTVFYDANDSGQSCDQTGTVLGGAAGSGPLLGPAFPQVANTADLANRITAYMKGALPNNPMLPYVGQLVSVAQQYNVNPTLAVAQAEKETSFGTAGVGRPPQDDIFAIRGNGDKGFGSNSSISDAINGYYKLLASGTYLGSPSDDTTVAQVINTYAPPSENDTAAYIAFVTQVMSKILSGIATTPGTDPTPSTTVLNPCTGLATGVTTAGAYGWDITGPNPMVTYNMEDARWASLPYGSHGTIGVDGCGPTSVAMVAATLTGNTSITPATIASTYGSYHTSDGTSWALFTKFAQDDGLNVTDLGTNLAAAAQIIQQGGLVIISVNPGYFTSEGHIMVLRAITPDGGSFYLNDPAAPGPAGHGNDDAQAFTAAFLQGQGNMAQLWGYTK
jgi:hypothetical protein